MNKNDLQTTRADFALAVDRLDHAGRHGGLRELAGAEFTHEFRRGMLNEAMALAVVRMRDRAIVLESALVEIGEPAKHFQPTLTLANQTISDIRDVLVADSCDRVEVANRIEEFEGVMIRFQVKLAKLKPTS